MLLGLVLALLAALPGQADPILAKYLTTVPASELVVGADGYGGIRDDLPVAPLLSGDRQVGWAFVTSDFVGTTGYSGKPIHTMVAVDDKGVISGVKLVKHSEPIVLIGIPEAKIKALVASICRHGSGGRGGHRGADMT